MLGQIPFGMPAANIGYNNAFNPNPYYSQISGPGEFIPLQSSTLGGSYYPGVNEVLVGGTGATSEFQNMYLQPSLFPPVQPSNFQKPPAPVSSVEKARTKVLRDSRQDQSGDEATVGIAIQPVATPYPGVYHRQYIVVNVVPGSDAGKHGIQVGDTISKIEEFGTGHLDPVSRFSLEEMTKNLAGKIGRTVDLEIRSKLYSRNKEGRLEPVKKCSVKRDCSIGEPFRLLIGRGNDAHQAF